MNAFLELVLIGMGQSIAPSSQERKKIYKILIIKMIIFQVVSTKFNIGADGSLAKLCDGQLWPFLWGESRRYSRKYLLGMGPGIYWHDGE